MEGFNHLNLEIYEALKSDFKYFTEKSLEGIDDLKIRLQVEPESAEALVDDYLRIPCKPKTKSLFCGFIGSRQESGIGFPDWDFNFTKDMRSIFQHHEIFKVVGKANDIFHDRRPNFLSKISTRLHIGAMLQETGVKNLIPYLKGVKTPVGASVVLAGGSVYANSLEDGMREFILEGKSFKGQPNPDEKSDLDLFVIGPDAEAKQKLLRELLVVLSATHRGLTGNQKIHGDFKITHFGGVFKIHGYNREIQIILSSAQDVAQLLSGFDMSHIQCAFDGESIITTSLFKLFTPQGMTFLTVSKPAPYRLAKALRRGLIPVGSSRTLSLQSKHGTVLLEPTMHLQVNNPDILISDIKLGTPTMVCPSPILPNRAEFAWFFPKRNDIEWKELSLIEAVKMSEDIVALERGFSNYTILNSTFPVSPSCESSKDIDVYHSIIHNCEILEIDGDKISIEGFLLMKDLEGFEDPKLKTEIRRRYDELEELLKQGRAKIFKKYARESEIYRDEIRRLNGKEILTRSDKSQIKSYKSKLQSLKIQLDAIEEVENRYAPSRISKKDIAHVANTMDKIKGEELFQDHTKERKVVNLVGRRDKALGEILSEYPFASGEAVGYPSLKGNAVKIRLDNITPTLDVKLMVTLPDSSSISMEKAMELGIRFNLNLFVSMTNCLRPNPKNSPESMKYCECTTCHSPVDFLRIKAHYKTQGLKFATVGEFMERFIKDLNSGPQNELRKMIAQGFLGDETNSRDEGYLGRKPLLKFKNAYAIKK